MTDKLEVAPLPYDYDALEPHIDEATMKLHHDKHYAGYVSKYNAAVEGTDLEGKDVDEVLSDLDSVPDSIKNAVRNAGGGASNHAKFWEWMSPEGKGDLGGEIAPAIEQAFGGLDEFKDMFKDAALKVFGSGWTWLVVDNGSLKIVSTANQDTPISSGQVPILGLDLWEHSYYKKFGPARADYVDAWWNIVNWEKVSEDYDNAQNQ